MICILTRPKSTWEVNRLGITHLSLVFLRYIYFKTNVYAEEIEVKRGITHVEKHSYTKRER